MNEGLAGPNVVANACLFHRLVQNLKIADHVRQVHCPNRLVRREDRDVGCNRDGWGGLGMFLAGLLIAFMVGGLCSAVGTITGIVALARGEGQSWRSVVGLVVNVPVVLFVLYVIAVTRQNNGG